MEQLTIDWLLSLDDHIIKTYLATLMLGMFFSFKSSINHFPAVLCSLFLVVAELSMLHVDEAMWPLVEQHLISMERWFFTWVLLNGCFAFLLIKLINYYKIKATLFTRMISYSFLFFSFLQAAMYTKIMFFEHLDFVDAIYRIAVPSINLAMAILVCLAIVLGKFKESKVYGSHL